MPTRTTTSSSTTPAGPLVFPHYLFPPLSFLRAAPKPHPTGKKPSASDSAPPQHLPGTTQFLKCRGCLSDLCTTSAIISKGFTGRHGRAYLLSRLSSPSITFAAPTSRALMTGLHQVSDMACSVCEEDLGWRYDGADEVEQRYKVGKYILEREKVVKGGAWEVVGATGTVEGGEGEGEGKGLGRKEGEGGEEEVRVDVGDEVEMGWLVRGAWTAEKALERRGKKKDGGGK